MESPGDSSALTEYCRTAKFVPHRFLNQRGCACPISRAGQAFASAVIGFQMLFCRVSGIRNSESTKHPAGTAIG